MAFWIGEGVRSNFLVTRHFDREGAEKAMIFAQRGCRLPNTVQGPVEAAERDEAERKLSPLFPA